MRLSTNTTFSRTKGIPLTEALSIIKNAGFTAYDISLDLMARDPENPFSKDDWFEYTKTIKTHADSIGLPCNQSHAPFPSSVGDKAEDERIFGLIVRSMEIAAFLGAEVIVVHPIQHLVYAEHREELFEMNVEFYKKLVPYAEKFGIKIATENMWQRYSSSHTPSDSVCSRSGEFCGLIDAVDSPWLVGCFDIGHASLMGADIPDFIRKMGNERLLALHVHDTDFKEDLHTAPFMANIDYISVAAALREIGYKGDFTFEAGNFFKRLPLELIPSGAEFIAEIGKFLISEIEK